MGSRTFIDQMGRDVTFTYPPKRIISLVPSQTELLFDLGVQEHIIGITKFCIHPAEFFTKAAKIGGTKKIDLQKISALQPDLIIGNKEENERSQVEALMKEFPVWMSDINTLDDAVDMISKIGELTDRGLEATKMTDEITSKFASLAVNRGRSVRVSYFIWKNPFMVAGKETFINDILNRAGFTNSIEQSRYPDLSLDSIRDTKPELIMLSSEPYPFKDVHVTEMQGFFPEAIVRIVDGEMFSWYGSRLLQTAAYLSGLRTDLNLNY